jgi:hypothetical protein
MMKIKLLVLFVALAGSCTAQDVVTDKLIATVKSFHQALVVKSIATINQHTDKTLSYGHSNGWVENKRQLMDNLASGKSRYNRFDEDSITATVSGNLAQVRFKADIDAAEHSQPLHFKLYVLEVWVKKSNRWVLLARQATKRA